MPTRPLQPCRHPGCRVLTKGGYCEAHQQERRSRSRDRRPPPEERGYTYQWRKASKEYLGVHPWCAQCQRDHRLTPATEVDHVVSHRGNQILFWDETNWQPLCHRCHSRKTATEDGGFGNKQGKNR